MAVKTTLNPATCDRRACGNQTDNWKKDGWVYSSGETIRGTITLHDHRSVGGHYCSWACFAKEPVLDL